jgi:glutathione S-transferase
MAEKALLYTFRRCPYAIRARMAIAASGVAVDEHEVALRAKPASMLAASPKGTVPVLVLPSGKVIDESLDIMRWALAQHDPYDWLQGLPDSLSLIARNDREFKPLLDAYKYPERHRLADAPPEPIAHRNAAHAFLSELTSRIERNGFLLDTRPRLADVAIMPFIRQFAAVDPTWWDSKPYRGLHEWLAGWLADGLFEQTMTKRAPSVNTR